MLWCAGSHQRPLNRRAYRAVKVRHCLVAAFPEGPSADSASGGNGLSPAMYGWQINHLRDIAARKRVEEYQAAKGHQWEGSGRESAALRRQQSMMLRLAVVRPRRFNLVPLS